MHPTRRDDCPAGLRLDAAVTDDGRAHFALHVIGEDGSDRRVASWNEPVPDRDGPSAELGPGPTPPAGATRLVV